MYDTDTLISQVRDGMYAESVIELSTFEEGKLKDFIQKLIKMTKGQGESRFISKAIYDWKWYAAQREMQEPDDFIEWALKNKKEHTQKYGYHFSNHTGQMLVYKG